MIGKVKSFLRDVKIETKKVVFPKFDELVGATKVLIVFVIFMSLFLGLVDFGLSRIVRGFIR